MIDNWVNRIEVYWIDPFEKQSPELCLIINQNALHYRYKILQRIFKPTKNLNELAL